MRIRFAVVVPLLFAAACGDDEGGNNTPIDAAGEVDADDQPDADPGPQPSAERGEYLVNAVLLCGDCHTPRGKGGVPDLTNFLAGVECFVDGNGPADGGCINTANLTSDVTGLMNRSDAEIKDMLLDGVRPNGDALNPFMPYWLFHNMTTVDADSIVLYLRTVPAIEHDVPASDPMWDVEEPAEPLDLTTVPATTTTSAAIERGRYIATMACIDCHTPHTNPFDLRSVDPTKFFAGGNAFEIGGPFGTVVTRNLTPHATGLPEHTAEDIVRILEEGVDPDGALVCPPMPSGMGGFGNLTAEDQADVAAFIDALAPIENETSDCAFTPPP